VFPAAEAVSRTRAIVFENCASRITIRFQRQIIADVGQNRLYVSTERALARQPDTFGVSDKVVTKNGIRSPAPAWHEPVQPVQRSSANRGITRVHADDQLVVCRNNQTALRTKTRR